MVEIKKIKILHFAFKTFFGSWIILPTNYSTFGGTKCLYVEVQYHQMKAINNIEIICSKREVLNDKKKEEHEFRNHERTMDKNRPTRSPQDRKSSAKVNIHMNVCFLTGNGSVLYTLGNTRPQGGNDTKKKGQKKVMAKVRERVFLVKKKAPITTI